MNRVQQDSSSKRAQTCTRRLTHIFMPACTLTTCCEVFAIVVEDILSCKALTSKALIGTVHAVSRAEHSNLELQADLQWTRLEGHEKFVLRKSISAMLDVLGPAVAENIHQFHACNSLCNRTELLVSWSCRLDGPTSICQQMLLDCLWPILKHHLPSKASINLTVAFPELNKEYRRGIMKVPWRKR